MHKDYGARDTMAFDMIPSYFVAFDQSGGQAPAWQYFLESGRRKALTGQAGGNKNEDKI